MASEKKTRWMAVVVADDSAPYPNNWLLGGVKVHKLGPWDSKEDAEQAMAVSRDTNEQAGRKVARAYVRPYRPKTVVSRKKTGAKDPGIEHIYSDTEESARSTFIMITANGYKAKKRRLASGKWVVTWRPPAKLVRKAKPRLTR